MNATSDKPDTRCCVCGSADVTYRNYRDQPFCDPCAEGVPAVLRTLPSVGEIAHDALDSLIEDFRSPAFRVEFFASLIAVVPCTRARLPFLPSFLVALAAGKAARWAYESVEEIRAKLGGSDAAGDV